MREDFPACLRITLAMTALFFLTGSAPVSKATYLNPVLIQTFQMRRGGPERYYGTLGIGDPAVISYAGKYYLYPTGDNHSYDVYLSNDLVHWSRGPKVFRSPENRAWAPDVFFDRSRGMFYLYYTVNGKIGVAASERPDGVFRNKGPLIENAIDAHLFQDDDGKYYLYYARYPNFAIFVQPMESPVKTKGAPVRLLSPSQPWEMKDVPVSEAPWVIKHRGTYYLLYSGGSPDSQYYAVGYATSRSPDGPFSKYGGNPVMHAGEGVFGPGHPSVVKDGAGKLWMVYHQQKNETKGWNRMICIDPIRFDQKGVLHVKATRGTVRPAPVMQPESP